MINEKRLEDKMEVMSLEEATALVRDEVNRILLKAPLIIREYTKHLMTSRGKFIRASSVMLCAEDKEGKIKADAVKIAAAIELLHLATLVHDDIIDNADLRRGEVTLQKKYGKRTAVICGDYLLSVSLRLATSLQNKKDFVELNLPDYVGRVCLGELNQHLNNGNIGLSIYRYLKIISGKTAALFEASYMAGAIFSGCEEKELKHYKQLGYYVGMIFQLTDDCIDFEDTVESAFKPVQSDYEQGVITLPLIHALDQEDELKTKALSQGLTRIEINEAVKKTGGIGFTKLMVQKYHAKSMKLIEKLDVAEAKREKLIGVLNRAARLA
ncbi:MAG: Polyprenyl synthetase [Herbinix sp.]|jgi:heptaprenyl diphosphate synthase|nr:Polyprenyl synthetase [Herbinix sp.]